MSKSALPAEIDGYISWLENEISLRENDIGRAKTWGDLKMMEAVVDRLKGVTTDLKNIRTKCT